MGDLKANPSKLELSLEQHALQFYFLFSGVLGITLGLLRDKCAAVR
jgi:hypothetical protein